MNGLRWLVLAALCGTLNAWGDDWAAARGQWNAYEKGMQDAQALDPQTDAKKADELKQQADLALARCKAAYEKAGIAASDDKDARAEYLGVLQARGDFDLAADFLAESVKRAPGDASLIRQQGEMLSKGGKERRKQASAVLRHAMQLAPTGPDADAARLALAGLYFDEMLYDFAREEYAAVLKSQPESVPARLGQLLIDVHDGKLVQASEALNSLGSAALPYDAMLRVRLRVVLLDFERWRPLEDTVENHRAFCRLAYQAGRPMDAILAGKAVVRRDASDFKMLNLLGAMYGQLGSLPQAREVYTKSLEIQPDQPAIRETLQRLEEAMQQAPAKQP